MIIILTLQHQNTTNLLFHPLTLFVMSTQKSLNESIAEIKNANMSRKDKVSALIKLGLRSTDINLIMTDVDITAREARALAAQRRESNAFTFGVEIECNVARNALVNAAINTSFRYEYQGYNHNDSHNCFKFVPDASLHGANPIECVSPVLKGINGKKALKTACQTLNAAGATVNSSCGLHVHIGAADLSGEQYVNVFVNYQMLESIINKFMAPSRRNGRWAKSIAQYNLRNLRSQAEVARMLGSRYHAVNAESYARHRTIEFRQHGGSTDFTKIFNWVNFCGKLVNWSKTNRLSAPVNSIDDIKFLTKAEKEFFKARIELFANR